MVSVVHLARADILVGQVYLDFLAGPVSAGFLEFPASLVQVYQDLAVLQALAGNRDSVVGQVYLDFLDGLASVVFLDQVFLVSVALRDFQGQAYQAIQVLVVFPDSAGGLVSVASLAGPVYPVLADNQGSADFLV